MVLNKILNIYSQSKVKYNFAGKFLAIAIIRVLTGVAQFSTLIYLVSNLSLNDFGEFTTFSIFIAYGTLLLGFNFHTFVARELAKHVRNEWSGLLFQNILFVISNLIILFVIVLYMVDANVFPNVSPSYFLLILSFAAINNQIENFAIATGNPFVANLNVLCRAIWIFPLLILQLFKYITLDINFVMLAWLLFEVIGISFILIKLRKLSLLSRPNKFIDLIWIGNGMRIGFKYTSLGLMLLMTFTIQRLLLGHNHSQEFVGIFQFFFSIAVFFPNLIETTLFSIILPKMIRQSSIFPGGVHSNLNFKLLSSSFIIVLIGLILVYFLLPLSLSYINKSHLIDYKYLFLFMSVYSSLYFISRIFHYHFYAGGKDGLLLVLNFSSLIVAVLSSLLLIPKHGLTGASFSLVITSLFMSISYGCAFYAFFQKK